jgi:hypothetical protein
MYLYQFSCTYLLFNLSCFWIYFTKQRPYSHIHFDAQYCDKKHIFEPWISKGQGKLIT